MGLVTFEDAETGEQIEINTSSSSVRSAFAAEEERRRKTLDKLFRLAGNRCRAARAPTKITLSRFVLFSSAAERRLRRMMPRSPQPTPAPIHDIAGPVWLFPYPVWVVVAAALAFLAL